MTKNNKKFLALCHTTITECGGAYNSVYRAYIIDTCFGRLSISPIESDRGSNLYSICMRFMDHSKFNKERFKKYFNDADLNKFSLKYNKHANEKGYRTFRVIDGVDSEIMKDEIICPNYTNGVTCVECGLCNGVKGLNDKRKNIVIPVHGALVKRWKQKGELIED